MPDSAYLPCTVLTNATYSYDNTMRRIYHAHIEQHNRCGLKAFAWLERCNLQPPLDAKSKIRSGLGYIVMVQHEKLIWIFCFFCGVGGEGGATRFRRPSRTKRFSSARKLEF